MPTASFYSFHGFWSKDFMIWSPPWLFPWVIRKRKNFFVGQELYAFFGTFLPPHCVYLRFCINKYYKYRCCGEGLLLVAFLEPSNSFALMFNNWGWLHEAYTRTHAHTHTYTHACSHRVLIFTHDPFGELEGEYSKSERGKENKAKGKEAQEPQMWPSRDRLNYKFRFGSSLGGSEIPHSQKSWFRQGTVLGPHVRSRALTWATVFKQSCKDTFHCLFCPLLSPLGFVY